MKKENLIKAGLIILIVILIIIAVIQISNIINTKNDLDNETNNIVNSIREKEENWKKESDDIFNNIINE